MCVDCYEVDLPEPYVSLADQLKENKETLALVGKFVGIPTGLFVLTCIVNYFIEKKLGPL